MKSTGDRFNQYPNQNTEPNSDQLTTYLQTYLERNHSCLEESETAQIQQLQLKLKHHIFELAAFGLVSCGKTAVLNALQGKKLGKTSPLHGTTEIVNSETLELSSKAEIKLIDTPGLDEVGGELKSEIAFKAAYQADLILFVTTGKLTSTEHQAIAHLQQTHKPLLVIFNKSDLLTDADREVQTLELLNELSNLVSSSQIISTTAKPLPRRIRLEYGDKAEEIWEAPAIDVLSLKQKILDILNQDGKNLLAINVRRSLQEIHHNLTERQLTKLLPQSTLASLIFVIKAIAILLLPSPFLDFGFSLAVDASVIILSIKFLGSDNWRSSSSLSMIINLILASISNYFSSSYVEITWLAVTTPWLINLIRLDAQNLTQVVPELLNKRISPI